MTIQNGLPFRSAIASLALLSSSPAFAHPGHLDLSLASGLLHPLSGFDHLAAMVAIGLLSARQAGKKIWALPLMFVLAMAAGMVVTNGAIFSAFATQFAIAACLVLTGFTLLTGQSLTLRVTAPLAGASGLFHGMAHASDNAGIAVSDAFVIGALMMTICLHLAGSIAGMAVLRMPPASRLRVWQLCGLGATGAGMFAAIA
jgi:urease accessory protein